MALESHIRELSEKHARLDSLIEKESKSFATDDSQISALKRQKLKIKEEIEALRHNH